MDNALKLAHWIRARLPYRRELLTHLKLQKLAFYCYGAALGFGVATEVGDDICFEAWAHGPVCRPLWAHYRAHGKGPIDFLSEADAPTYSPAVEELLLDTLKVYGALQAWSLREESHLEAPWQRAYAAAEKVIPSDDLAAHFRAKFVEGEVPFPEYLLFSSSARLDGIPVRGCASLHELASVVHSVVSPFA